MERKDEKKMKYDLDYQWAKNFLESRLSTGIQPKTGDLLENSYLTAVSYTHLTLPTSDLV